MACCDECGKQKRLFIGIVVAAVIALILIVRS